MADMKSWSGAKLAIKAFWAPDAAGDKVEGVLLQRNRNPGGRINAPFYVLQLTKPCEKAMLKNEAVKMDKGENIAVPENVNLAGLDELLGYEVQLTFKGTEEFNTTDGEVREVKQFDVKHSADVVNQAAASRYRPGNAVR